jgi:peptidoglycan-N-acetylglucosamine deacetylase
MAAAPGPREPSPVMLNMALINVGGVTRKRLVDKRVTLTFDNGPTAGITSGVLDALERRGIRATFFVVGDKLMDPGAVTLMRDAHAGGHWIGNHTLTHSVPLGDRGDAEYAAREIEETQARIGACAHPDKLFRPFGIEGRIGPHLLSRAARAHLLAHRYCCVIWNSVPRDWCDPAGWVDRCLADVRANDWTVVVLHDLPDACLPRLPELLARLDDLGAAYRQEFPEDVILTRAGRDVSMSGAYLADAPATVPSRTSKPLKPATQRRRRGAPQ